MLKVVPLLVSFVFGSSFLYSPSGTFGVYSAKHCETTLRVRTPKASNEDVDKYLQMRDIKKMKERGGAYEDYAEAKRNETMRQKGSYESLKGRKGTLDQRLRAVVAYKRTGTMDYGVSNDPIKQGPETNEYNDLYEMMECDEEDEDLNEDDEEYVYEKLITESMQESKLVELKKNLNAVSFQNDENCTQNSMTFERIEDDDGRILLKRKKGTNASMVPIHKPSKSGSWGVFERPADISRAYGGGRRITREEMRLMDEEYQLKSSEEAKTKSYAMKMSRNVENENEKRIREALSISRSYMMFGDRNRALQALDNIVSSNLVGLQSELDGEVYLEYAMVLETVDKGEESRKIYGQLVASSNSPKVKRSALQLLQGLEITMKLRGRGPISSKPVMDLEAMQTMSDILSVGLKDEWNDYKKKYTAPSSWLLEGKKEEDLYNLETIYDTYSFLLRSINSPLFLERVPFSVVRKAVRNMFLMSEIEKIELMRRKMPSLFDYLSDGRIYIGQESEKREIPTVSSSVTLTTMNNQSIPVATDSAYTTYNPVKSNGRGRSYGNGEVGISATDVFEKQLNGSWELVFSIYDKSSGQLKKVELGELRRCIFFSPKSMDVSDTQSDNKAIETFPSMWGLSVSNVVASIEWNANRNEFFFNFKNERSIRRSPAPWQDRLQPQHIVQIVWVDEDMMITNELNSMISEPDLFTVWRRMKPTKWKKY